MHEKYLNAIKSFEGYTPRAKWDYAQNSNGYGTNALHAGESIDRAEADRRFRAEIEQARSVVERHAQGWDEGTKAALTSLTFNTGTRWTSAGLGDAVRNFDIDAVEKIFLTYTKAGGEILPGLVKRRLAEVGWIRQATNPPATPPSDIGAMHPTVTAAASQSVDARSLDPSIASAPTPRSLAATAHALLALDAQTTPRDDPATLAAKRARRGRARLSSTSTT